MNIEITEQKDINIQNIVTVGIYLLLSLLFMGFIAFICIEPYVNKQEYTITKIEIMQDNDTTLYICTTDNDEEYIFENEDIWFVKMKSSNYALQLKRLSEQENIEVKITTKGIRWGLTSQYQNIIKIEEIK